MINMIDDVIYDITYIGIGSAVIRDTKPENRQQFPPFIEYIYNTTNYKIHIINIDLNFEKPYFLTQYFNNLEKLRKYDKERWLKEERKEQHRKASKKYDQANKDKICNHKKERQKHDIKFKLSLNLRARLRMAITKEQKKT